MINYICVFLLPIGICFSHNSIITLNDFCVHFETFTVFYTLFTFGNCEHPIFSSLNLEFVPLKHTISSGNRYFHSKWTSTYLCYFNRRSYAPVSSLKVLYYPHIWPIQRCIGLHFNHGVIVSRLDKERDKIRFIYKSISVHYNIYL